MCSFRCHKTLQLWQFTTLIIDDNICAANKGRQTLLCFSNENCDYLWTNKVLIIFSFTWFNVSILFIFLLSVDFKSNNNDISNEAWECSSAVTFWPIPWLPLILMFLLKRRRHGTFDLQRNCDLLSLSQWIRIMTFSLVVRYAFFLFFCFASFHSNFEL